MYVPFLEKWKGSANLMVWSDGARRENGASAAAFFVRAWSHGEWTPVVVGATYQDHSTDSLVQEALALKMGIEAVLCLVGERPDRRKAEQWTTDRWRLPDYDSNWTWSV